MPHVLDSLNDLKQSLHEEEEETTILNVMGRHHKYLKEYLNMLNHSNTSTKDKPLWASLFLCTLSMHTKAESDTFYPSLLDKSDRSLHLLSLKCQEEHEMMYEMIEEIREVNFFKEWSHEIETKIRNLGRFVSVHLKEEENILYPKAARAFREKELMKLTDLYLKRCLMYLEMEIENSPQDASRNDVITLS